MYGSEAGKRGTVQRVKLKVREGEKAVTEKDDEEIKTGSRGEKTTSLCYSWLQVQQCQDYEK